MSMKVPSMVMDLDHCHITLSSITTSGSVSAGGHRDHVPTTGAIGDRVMPYLIFHVGVP